MRVQNRCEAAYISTRFRFLNTRDAEDYHVCKQWTVGRVCHTDQLKDLCVIHFLAPCGTRRHPIGSDTGYIPQDLPGIGKIQYM